MRSFVKTVLGLFHRRVKPASFENKTLRTKPCGRNRVDETLWTKPCGRNLVDVTTLDCPRQLIAPTSDLTKILWEIGRLCPIPFISDVRKGCIHKRKDENVWGSGEGGRMENLRVIAPILAIAPSLEFSGSHGLRRPCWRPKLNRDHILPFQ